MGRSPCCDKVGVKKGPWTPEEDIVLVSYIQQHGPGNWRMVPAHTGLLRCSKSCRLRWTNYLRPGIRRGNFSSHEDRIIVHLQALLGNRWAAIASYLPQRTDNDIKNYWNTHLKKRLKKQQSPVGNEITRMTNVNSYSSSAASKGQWESRLQTDIQHAKKALFEALHCSDSSNSDLQGNENALNPVDPIFSQRNLNPSSPYASSIENISKLLEGWNRSSENQLPNDVKLPNSTSTTSSCSESQSSQYSTIPISSNNTQMECLNNGSFAWTSAFSSCEDDKTSADHFHLCQPVNFNSSTDNGIPFSVLEEWLMEETYQDQFSHVNEVVQELGCI